MKLRKGSKILNLTSITITRGDKMKESNSKVSSKIIYVSPDVAKSILLESVYSNQRRTNNNRVDFYSDEMEKGRFQPTSMLGFAVWGNGKQVLINGYHTLEAIVKSKTSHSLVAIYHEVSSDNDIAVLYEHYDIGMGRTPSQQDEPFRVHEYFGITRSDWSRVRPAIKYIVQGYPGSGGKSGSVVASIDLREASKKYWKDEIGLLFDTYDSCNFVRGDSMQYRAKRSIVIAIFLTILKFDTDNAIDFIYQVCLDDGLKKGDPRKKLHHFLKYTVNSSNPNARKTPGEISRGIAKCWNLWIKGEDVTALRVSPNALRENIILANTPLDGSIETLGFMRQYDWKFSEDNETA